MQIFDFSEALVIYTLLGGFIVLYGLMSLIVKERLYLSEACKKDIFEFNKSLLEPTLNVFNNCFNLPNVCCIILSSGCFVNGFNNRSGLFALD